MRSEVVDITTGLMKAVHYLSQGRHIAPKRKYVAAGSAVHASRRLRQDERKTVTALVAELASLDSSASTDSDRISALISELGKHPVKFVPIKREVRLKQSKTYPYRSKKRGG